MTTTGLDEHGFAPHGCPGPGAYAAPSQFNLDPHCPPESRAGKHVFAYPGAFTIKGRSKLSEWACDSPGPAAHNPAYRSVDPGTKPALFGRAERATEAKRFISRCLATSDGSEVPGPGAYRYKTGKGHAKTIGDAPAASIGTGQRPPINAAADPDVPGAKYGVPSALRPHNGTFSIAPLNRRELGAARDRATEGREYEKLYWGPGKGAPAGSGNGSSPMAYDPCALDVSGAHAAAPSCTFGKASLDAGAKVQHRRTVFMLVNIMLPVHLNLTGADAASC
jgi:hypothetical protein